MIKLIDILKEILLENEDLIFSGEVKDQITDNFVPLTDAVIDIIYPKERIQAFHIASPDEIDRVKRLINKENAISSFTEAKANNIKDVNFNLNSKLGGILFHLEGQKAFGSASDLGSSLDKSGRRWVSYKLFPKEFQDEFLKYDKTKINNIKTLREYYIFVNGLIKKYLDKIKEKNNSKEITHGSWNEILIKRIKVLSILANVEKLYQASDNPFSMADEPPFPKEELIEKLKSISNNLEITSDENKILNWFKSKGGVVR
jgi:GTP-sensing pleiotropic transcriptional regulator CodY